MRLFHVSEEPDIDVFEPRKPYRNDLMDSPPLVWAIDDERLPNFLTPRDCPRVTYHIPDGYEGFIEPGLFSSSRSTHVVAIESEWFNRMCETVLYLYEFKVNDFHLQDSIAGFYVSEIRQKPENMIIVDDIFKEQFKRNVEIRVLDNLFDLREKIIRTSLHWSMCRMGNARPKE